LCVCRGSLCEYTNEEVRKDELTSSRRQQLKATTEKRISSNETSDGECTSEENFLHFFTRFRKFVFFVHKHVRVSYWRKKKKYSYVCACVLRRRRALLYLCVYDSDSDSDSNPCVTFRARIANRVVKGSRCRGGIVNIRDGRTCARVVRRDYPTALWRFRASTSNSPSGHTRAHTHTHFLDIHHICVQQDTRVYVNDLLKLPMRQ